tara:strand:- start:3 stop:1145 length:1143 start_codon:yes stop_codon:yes gene_type:complete
MKNIFKGKKILVLRKEIYSTYYDITIQGFLEFGNPSNVFTIKFNSDSDFNEINKNIVKIIDKKDIDIFISASFYFILPTTFKCMSNILKIRIDGDDSSMFEIYSKWYAQFFDLNLTSSEEAREKFVKLGYQSIVFANMVNLSNININNKSEKDDIDISFIGTIKKKIDRELYINEIKNKYDLRTYGIDSKSGYLNTNQKYRLYQKSKINLNFSGVSIIRNNKEKKITTMQGRIFEIMAVGGFVLTEYTPTIKLFFEPGVHLEVFHNKNDLFKKIDYYLKNKSQREKIANSGKEIFFEKYQYKNYFPNLINEISNIEKINKLNLNYAWPNELKLFLCQFINYKYLYKYEYLKLVLKFLGWNNYLKNRFYRIKNIFLNNSYF